MYSTKVLFFVFVQHVVLSQQQILPHLSKQTMYAETGHEKDNEVKIDKCQPEKLWMLTRPGSHFPTAAQHEKMVARLQQLKQQILENNGERADNPKPELVNKFKDWKIEAGEPTDDLTTKGENEMKSLGHRTKQKFPKLFEKYDQESFRFKSINTKVFKKSMENFAEGLFDTKTAKDIGEIKQEDENGFLLNSTQYCPKWLSEMEKPEWLEGEMKKFLGSQNLKDVKNAILDNINVGTNMDDMRLVYQRCGMETGWSSDKSVSPWCLFFDDKTVLNVEFLADMESHFRDGYHFETNAKMSCVLFADMWKFLSQDDATKKASFNFVPADTLLRMLTLLELYKDAKEPSADNIDKDRKWQTSKLTPLGANLLFVSWKCTDDKGQFNKVQVYHNEELVTVQKCNEGKDCSMDKLKEAFKDSIDACDFDKVCGKNDKDTNTDTAKPNEPTDTNTSPDSANTTTKSYGNSLKISTMVLVVAITKLSMPLFNY